MIYYCRGKQFQLQGFNNLTKSLSLNVYKIFFTTQAGFEEAFYEQMDKRYNSNQLASISREMAQKIEANIISVSQHDFDPRGASAATLISEAQDVSQKTTLAHLDKSHIAIHTYPEIECDAQIATIRIDIDIATCGLISPLSILNYLFETFEPTVAYADYRIRGFTRDAKGRKHYIDHDIESIQDFIAENIINKYTAVDMNQPKNNTFHSRMLQKEIDLKDAVLDQSKLSDDPQERTHIFEAIKKEAGAIYASNPSAG